MKTLIVGADREGVRMLIRDESKVLADQYYNAAAAHRNERAVVEVGLQSIGLTWSDIDAYGVLTVSHSHTSGRVIQALLSTSAWYYGRSFQTIACETIQLDASVIVDQLRSTLVG